MDPGHVYHLFPVRTAARSSLQAHLRSAGIETLVHYPVPVHLQPAYRGRVPLGVGALPMTEAAATSVLSLPMFPHLTNSDRKRVFACAVCRRVTRICASTTSALLSVLCVALPRFK
jgi:dTDP-4-amino-4,6-dideoxygalactose transaminase